MGQTQHITPTPNGKWQIKGARNSKATKIFDTQAEAEIFGREIAKHQKSELFTHGKNGKIRKRDSYRNDPFPPKG
jgi:hypothetical protein